jgi:hypothetical protein
MVVKSSSCPGIEWTSSSKRAAVREIGRAASRHGHCYRRFNELNCCTEVQPIMIVIALAGVRTFQPGIATTTYCKNLKKGSTTIRHYYGYLQRLNELFMFCVAKVIEY